VFGIGSGNTAGCLLPLLLLLPQRTLPALLFITVGVLVLLYTIRGLRLLECQCFDHLV